MRRRAESAVAPALIKWHARQGRHDLPWQRERTPYRVWVSEIMLQQTQVATVIPYYRRFMQRFPDARRLADAPLDDVLHLWAGLGYYARARHLHRAAQRIRDEFNGVFPGRFDAVAGLPGIGRSTAGAILALSGGKRFAILDGNVKRVLSRYFGVAGDPTARATLDRLWELAEACTPRNKVAVYTQAIMDLGATVCTRRQPLCAHCPLSEGCYARYTGEQHEFPAARRARARRKRCVFMLIATDPDGGVWLERRRESGIWGGLWCLPEFPTIEAAQVFAAERLRRAQLQSRPLAAVEHAFTHFDLQITPLLARCAGPAGVMDGVDAVWYNLRTPAPIGLPAPVKSLLESLTGSALLI